MTILAVTKRQQKKTSIKGKFFFENWKRQIDAGLREKISQVLQINYICADLADRLESAGYRTWVESVAYSSHSLITALRFIYADQ